MAAAARLLPAVVASALAMAGCTGGERSSLVVGSTTSLFDTGLLDVLVPAFETAHPGYVVKILAVGTGEALALGGRRIGENRRGPDEPQRLEGEKFRIPGTGADAVKGRGHDSSPRSVGPPGFTAASWVTGRSGRQP
jgi:DNA-binding transcriptional LysR family regulator